MRDFRDAPLGPDSFFTSYWKRKRYKRVVSRGAGRVTVERHPTGRLHVSVPYREPFVREAKDAGGEWKVGAQCWSFPSSSRAIVVRLIERWYGESKVPAWMRNV